MPLQGKIDVDRGVAMRQVVRFDDPTNPNKFSPDLRYGGLTVYMYKDDPGVYYDVHGKPLPEHIAKSAGFPVDRLAKQRRKKEALAQLEAKLRQELELADQEDEILAAKGGWKVIALPMDRAKVVDAETGEAVTPMPMPRNDALALLEGLTQTDEQIKTIRNTKSAKGSE